MVLEPRKMFVHLETEIDSRKMSIYPGHPVTAYRESPDQQAMVFPDKLLSRTSFTIKDRINLALDADIPLRQAPPS